jgi:hypothetical protein
MERRLRELDRLDREYGVGAISAAALSSLPTRRSGSAVPGVLGTALIVGTAITALLAWHPAYGAEHVRRLLDLDAGRAAAPQAPKGQGEFAFIMTQPGSDAPVAWSPCREIEIEINPQGAPPDYAELVDTTVRRTGEATGLTFRIIGESDDRDFEGRRPGDPVLVTWATDEEVPDLAGDVVGIGGSTAVERRPGFLRYETGVVVLDRDVPRVSRDGEVAQAIMDHEFGHLVGLGHVDDPGQLMDERLSVLTYGPGDREGLARLGSVPCS